MEAKPLGENCPWQGSGAGQSETRAALAQSREAELSGKQPAASLGYILNSALPGQQKKEQTFFKREFLLQGIFHRER